MTSPPSLGRTRKLLVPLTNVTVIVLAYTVAFLLRFDFSIPEPYSYTFLATLPAAVIIQYASFTAFKLNRGWWRYVSISDFLNAVRGATVGGLGLASYVLLFHRHSFYPRSVF